MQIETGIVGINNQAINVPLQSVKVTGSIFGTDMKMSMQQTFTNKENSPMEAIYRFPLPDKATVTGFVMESDKRRIVAEHAEREEAFEKYDEAIMEGNRASLLDMERPNIFTLSLGNLAAGKTITINIDWLQTLEERSGEYRYILPTTISPRFIPAEQDADSDIPVSETINSPISEDVPYGLQLELNIYDKTSIKSVKSPSHSTEISFEEEFIQIKFASETVAMDRDFHLHITPASAEKIATARLHEEEGERFLACTLNTGLLSDEVKSDPDREVIFLLDCSGSMRGSSITEAKRAISIILKALPEESAFNIVRFGSSFENYMEKIQPATADNIENALEYVNRIDANLGGTEILAPLSHIFDTKLQRKQREIVFITDGQVSNESEIIELSEKNKTNTRIFTVGIGYGANHHLVNEMARVTGGDSLSVSPDERIDKPVLSLFQQIMGVVVSNVKVDLDALDVQAPEFIALLPEKNTTFYLRLNDMVLPESFNITADVAGKKETWNMSIMKFESDFKVAPFFARNYIADLEKSPPKGSKQRRGRKNEPNRAVVNCAIKYKVISSFTSLVAVEKLSADEKVREETKLKKVPILLTHQWGEDIQPMMMEKNYMRMSSMPKFSMVEPAGMMGKLLCRAAPKSKRRHASKGDVYACYSLMEAEPMELSAPAPMGNGDLTDLMTFLDAQKAGGGFPEEFMERVIDELTEITEEQFNKVMKELKILGLADLENSLKELIIMKLIEVKFAEDKPMWEMLLKKTIDRTSELEKTVNSDKRKFKAALAILPSVSNNKIMQN